MTQVWEDLRYTWPGDAWATIVPNPVFEVFSDTAGQNPALAGQLFMSDFGPVGLDRLTDILEQAGVSGTLLISGRAAELYPEAVRRFVDLGGDLAGHSYAQDIRVADLADDEAERANIRRCTDAIVQAAGIRPTGWISPAAASNPNTARLLAEEGYTWFGDRADHELPYATQQGGLPLAILPYAGMPAVNDLEVQLIQGNPPRVYVDNLRDILVAMRAEYDLTGRPALIRISAHAHLYGRPSLRHAFRQAIELAQQTPGVRFSTIGAVASQVLEAAGSAS